MPKNTSTGAERQPSPKVVVPSRRAGGWRGWAMLADGETREPTRNVGDSRILQDQILPTGKKRDRRCPERPDSAPKRQSSAKRRDTVLVNLTQEVRSHTKPRSIQECATSEAGSQVQLKREIRRLKIENDLRALAESCELKRLEAEVRRLESLKAELNRTVDRLMFDSACPDRTEIASVSDDILRKKEKIVERQIFMIKELESSLSKAFEHDILRSKARDIEFPTCAASVEDFMRSIKLGIICTADLLSICLHPSRKVLSSLRKNAELESLFGSAVKNSRIVQSVPDLVLRAVLFCIIRDHILHSQTWTALHGEGFMLRAYQRAIQQTAGSVFFETFHKAALLDMVKHDSEFEACFLGAQIKELQLRTMDLLDPILDPVPLEENRKDLLRAIDHLFSQAFSFRAKCLSPDGVRYQVIHFEPGEPFNPVLMEAQDATGTQLSSPAQGTEQPIELCVHGIIVAHRNQEPDTGGMQKLNAMGQPFMSPKSRARNGTTDGELISGKAIVLLR